MDPNRINPDALLACRLVAHCEHHESLGSTNDRAREWAAELPLDQSALVVADEQTAGRGRGSNRWWTGSGSIACSLLFTPSRAGIAVAQSHLISLAAAVAIVDAAAPFIPGNKVVGLHWPNDVFADGRKLAGILVESLAGGRHILGFGVNVNNSVADAPPDVQNVATTIRDLSGREVSRTAMLAAILEQLETALAALAADSAALCRRANQCCLQHGRTLALESGGRTIVGVCGGVADDGALLLDTERGRERFFSGALRHDLF